MNLNFKNFTVVSLLLLWVFSINIQSQHEISYDHLVGGEAHQCLSLNGEKDDWQVSLSEPSCFTLVKFTPPLSKLADQPISYSLYATARGPPQLNYRS